MTTNGRWHDRITYDPRILGGKPTIRGLRISVEQLLRAMAGGISEGELLAEYPELQTDDFRAVLEYAAERVADERVIEMTGP